MSEPTPLNPLDKRSLGKSVAEALIKSEPNPLRELEKFDGAGIYAIYYGGDFEAYAVLKRRSVESPHGHPIYAGKAVPAGARTGNVGLDVPAGTVLHKRLKEHASSIRAASNLSLDDFACKFLVVDDIWIPLGESLLVAWFAPLWNKLVDGFGNHAPGKGRENQQKSRWDTIHPGRDWANRLPDREKETADDILREVVDHLSGFSI